MLSFSVVPFGYVASPVIAPTGESRRQIESRVLDAIDGTPVLDLKPYFHHYDRVKKASVSEWVNELMEGYLE